MTELRTLVFDTETDGKRQKGKNPPLSSEPAITQIAAILFLGRRPISHLSTFVQPLNYDKSPATIPDEEFFIKSGITQATVDAGGIPLRTGLAMFNQMVRNADRIVAHNIQFDDPVVRSNYSRVTAPQREYWNTPKFCTMQTLENVLKLPGKYGYKWPTLDESYRALVDPNGFEGAHDAMVDVEACAKVLWACDDAIAAGDARFEGNPLWQLPENWPEE